MSGRFGLYGGTFNPIHVGHLRAAEEVVEALRAAGERLIVPINRKTKFYKTAQEHGFGERLTDEYEALIGGWNYLGQIFEGGFLEKPQKALDPLFKESLLGDKKIIALPAKGDKVQIQEVRNGSDCWRRICPS